MNITSGYIKGCFIVNLMTNKNSHDEKCVFFICHHDEKGAMGFMVNQIVDHVKFSDILDWSDAPSAFQEELEVPVLWGGSQESNRGFILHSLECMVDQTMPITEVCGLTTNLEFLKKISDNHSTQKAFLFLGHLNWGPGELERDLMKKPWVVMPSSYHSLFEVAPKDKWQHLISKLPYPKFYKPSNFLCM